MITRKLELIYDEGSFENGEFKVFSAKEISEFPKDVKMDTNMAVTAFSLLDLDWFKNLVTENETIDDNDYRFLVSASLDGKYIEVSEMCFMYIKKHLNSGLIIYDPTGELEDKWNGLTYKKK